MTCPRLVEVENYISTDRPRTYPTNRLMMGVDIVSSHKTPRVEAVYYHNREEINILIRKLCEARDKVWPGPAFDSSGNPLAYFLLY